VATLLVRITEGTARRAREPADEPRRPTRLVEQRSNMTSCLDGSPAKRTSRCPIMRT